MAPEIAKPGIARIRSHMVVATNSDGPAVGGDSKDGPRIVGSYPSGTSEWTGAVAYDDGSGMDLLVYVLCARAG